MKTLKILIFILLIGIFVGNSTSYVNIADSTTELASSYNINIQEDFVVVNKVEFISEYYKKERYLVTKTSKNEDVLNKKDFINDS